MGIRPIKGILLTARPARETLLAKAAAVFDAVFIATSQ